MTADHLADHLDKIATATVPDWDELLTHLLERCWPTLAVQSA